MDESDFRKIADAIDTVLGNTEDEAAIESARKVAIALCEAHPLPY
jgi:glycine/serine hydroxymethyltransferase